MWHIPDDLNPLVSYLIKYSESLYCCICIWCVNMLVAEDSVKAVCYYKEVHKLTVSIIVAGCLYIFISL